jgi:hypothetical protein
MLTSTKAYKDQVKSGARVFSRPGHPPADSQNIKPNRVRFPIHCASPPAEDRKCDATREGLSESKDVRARSSPKPQVESGFSLFRVLVAAVLPIGVPHFILPIFRVALSSHNLEG